VRARPPSARLGHFTHSIAGSVEALYLLTHADLSLRSYLGGFLLPAFLGNAIGGVSLVAALNHAQVAAGRREARR
jgi:formate/nitrite transporter FocA (FNT family)